MAEIKTDYLQNPLTTYLERLASKDPVPGGGSAGALSLSLSAALLSMVANFTIGKKRYLEFEAEAKEILKRTEAIRQEAAQLAEEDSVAYLQYRRAAEMDKEAPGRQEALIAATGAGNKILLRTAELSRQVLNLAKPLLEKGNPYLLSDVACAVSLARSAFEMAEINILINLSGGLNLPEASKINESLRALRRAVISESEEILIEVKRKLSS
ncbi:MAG: cyclodeaminase/cyclohydrolase family protein [Candidatus Omnitrophica bacterium]|nr:cyclodeaminase/cyclohydrolase family protein [Candidatus Omnitrophota bacterium]